MHTEFTQIIFELNLLLHLRWRAEIVLRRTKSPPSTSLPSMPCSEIKDPRSVTMVYRRGKGKSSPPSCCGLSLILGHLLRAVGMICRVGCSQKCPGLFDPWLFWLDFFGRLTVCTWIPSTAQYVVFSRRSADAWGFVFPLISRRHLVKVNINKEDFLGL